MLFRSEKGGLKIWMIYLGYFLLVGGLLMIIAGAAMGNGDGSGPPIGTIILAFGLILFIIGLVLVIIPCCLKHYIVKLHLLKKSMMGAVWYSTLAPPPPTA